MQQNILSILKAQDTGFVEDLYVTFFNKTDPFIPTKREDYWTQALKTLVPHCLNIEESIYGCYFVQIFLNSFDSRPLVLGLQF